MSACRICKIPCTWEHIYIEGIVFKIKGVGFKQNHIQYENITNSMIHCFNYLPLTGHRCHYYYNEHPIITSKIWNYTRHWIKRIQEKYYIRNCQAANNSLRHKKVSPLYEFIKYSNSERAETGNSKETTKYIIWRGENKNIVSKQLNLKIQLYLLTWK